MPDPQSMKGRRGRRASLLLAALLGLPLSLSAQTEILHATGLAPGDSFGLAVAAAGDVDGDGVGDLLVAAPFADPAGLPDAGRVTLLSGASGAILLQIDGTGPGELFGNSVAGLGDLDGDGASDLLVGNPFASPGGLSFAGQARVYSGASGASLFVVDGAADMDVLGFSVAGVGDMDADGVPDFATGAQLADPAGLADAGEARVFSGASGVPLLVLAGNAASDQFGASVSGAGDLDGDGVPDLLVGAAQDPFGVAGPGYARAFSGASGAALLSIAGTAPGDAFGTSVAGGGDVDGDGVPDLLIGAPFADVGSVFDAGAASAFSGATGGVLFSFAGTDGNGALGQSVALAGDMDGDGQSELLAGAPFVDAGPNSNAGVATVFSGSSGSPLLAFTGSGFGNTAGFSVAGAGDLDGDGRADAAIGVPGGNPDAFTGTGEVRVFKIDGAPDTQPPVLTVLSPVDGALANASSVSVSVLVADASATSVASAPGGLAASLPPGGGSATGVLPLLDEGNNAIVVTATDASGNSASATITVDRDMTPPAVALLSPADGASVSGSMMLSAESPDAGLASLSVRVDGVEVASSGFSPLSVPFDFSGSSGSVTIVAVATDLAGNSASDPATVSVGGGGQVSFRLTPDVLQLRPNTPASAVVTVHVAGSLPAGACELRVASSPGVPATSTQGNHVIKFNRRALVDAIRAAVLAGDVNPQGPVTVSLAVGGIVRGTDSIRVAMPATQ
ncbi:MAG TPA: Ig-like domain-containing protein [Planctomycetota bacterium]|jgi:hypothetical protein|nr:Ig-like domain-containing protein [Planctomycetota bacterium]